MSGVLHPVGPEPARTYWVRRGLLIAIVLVLAVFVAVAVANLTKAAVVTAPPPAPVPPATSPTATPTRAAAPGPSASPTPPSASTAPSTPAGTSTASSRPTPSAPVAPTSPAKPRPTTTIVGTPDCRPADLRVTLEGDKTPAAGQKTRFTVSLTNAGSRTCLTSVTAKNFELRIHSGKDRIWSTADCTASVRAFDKKLAARSDVAWTITWDGRRSVRDETCEQAPERLRPGTYRATAELDGAEPVQLRQVLR